MNVRQAEDLGKLLTQSDLHFVFGGIDTVLSQAAGLDVAIQDDDLMSALGDFLRGKHARGTRTNHEYSFQVPSLRVYAAGNAENTENQVNSEGPGHNRLRNCSA